MQQTDKYKLNLIEASDTFSPDPLNENARRLEEAIAAEAAAQDQARAADIAALDQRLQVFEAHKFVIGHASQPPKEFLGFKPRLLWVLNNMGVHVLLFEGWASNVSGLAIQEDGFYHDGSYANCRYAAFA